MNENEQPSDGGPAFPIAVPDNFHAAYDGMSLRDYLAGQVVPAVMSAVCAGTHTSKRSDEGSPQFIARTSYEIADAMLIERAKL
jgi:hypothetical protein